jgi:CubicO group peptidase (beta-lactamase class C family)
MKFALFYSLTVFALSVLALPVCAQSHTENIDKLMLAIHQNGQFMGAVLVAENGKIIFEKGYGYADRQAKEKFTPATPCYIGSLSKQFTGAGIGMLKAKGVLDYSEPVRKYFPDLPAFYQPVTILDLLHHCSGLALFDDFPGMTEQDVYAILQKQTALRFTPGEKFEYCNANYTLLGMLIEKLSGKSLDAYLTEYVFKPCGMKNTYVDEPAVKGRKRAVGYYLFGDEYNTTTYIGGAASVVSTVEDLYKWDQALYHPKFMAEETLAEMFTPGKQAWRNSVYGKMSYGFGWFISGDHADSVQQHDGGFAGFRSYIERQPLRHNTIIYVSNVRHSLKDSIRAAIRYILHDRPYSIPKISGANWIMQQAKEKDVAQAIREYKRVSSGSDSSRYYFSESECNTLGYYLMRNSRTADAILFFELNAERFPGSGNVFDSLGEAWLKAGNKEKALAAYKKALALNPDNKGTADIVKQLEQVDK